MAAAEWHTQTKGLHMPLYVPKSLQKICKGALASARHSHGSNVSCLFIMPSRQPMRVKGLSYGADTGAQWSKRYCRRRCTLPTRSLANSRRPSTASSANISPTRLDCGSLPAANPCHGVFSVTHTITGRTYKVSARRGLTVSQAGRFMQVYRLQAMRNSAWRLAAGGPDHSSEGLSSQQCECNVTSHPISLPASGRSSESGSGRDVDSPRSETSHISSCRAVQGIPALPSRPGRTCAHGPRMTREEYSRRSQASLRLLHEFLRRDYAIGYLLLGWMLRMTWSVAPAIALLLGLPQPDTRSKAQLPVLMTWMLSSSKKRGATASAEKLDESTQQELLTLLGEEELLRLQEQLTGPTAAVSSLAEFLKAQQTLAGAPATAQQVLEYMKKDQQLMELFHGLNPAANLAAATSAVAAAAQLSATEQNAAAASSVLAALAQLTSTQHNVAAVSSAAAALGQLASTQQNASAAAVALDQLCVVDKNVAADGSDAGQEAQPRHLLHDAPDEALIDSQYAAGAAKSQGDVPSALGSTSSTTLTNGLKDVIAGISSTVSRVVQQVLPQKKDQQDAATSGSELHPSILAQLQVLQQRLPDHQDRASMLQEYQAWLDSVKDCLLQQHEQTQMHLSSLKSELASAATSLRQSEAYKKQIEQQQMLLQQSKQQALEQYQMAKETIQHLQQQLAAGGPLTDKAGSLDTSTTACVIPQSIDAAAAQADIAKADLAVAEQQLEKLKADHAGVKTSNIQIMSQMRILQSSYGQIMSAYNSQTAAKADLDDALASLDAAVADVADNTARANEELDELMRLLFGGLPCVKHSIAGPAQHAGGSSDGKAEIVDVPANAPALEADAQPVTLAMAAAPLVSSSGGAPVEACYAAESPSEQEAEKLLFSADQIIAEVEQVVKADSAPPGKHLQQQPEMQQIKQGSQQPTALQTHTVRVLTPPRPKEFSAAVLFLDQPQQAPMHKNHSEQQQRPQQQHHFAGLHGALLESNPSSSADSLSSSGGNHRSAELAPSSQHIAAVFGKLPDLPDMEVMLCDLIASSTKQAQATDLSNSNDITVPPVVAWARRWSASSSWDAKAAWLQHWASSQLDAGTTLARQVAAAAAQLPAGAAAAAAQAVSAADAAKSKVDGKGHWEQRTLKEEVLAMSGLLSLISPNWWTEEALGTAHHASTELASAKARSSAVVDVPVLQEAFGSDGSGMEGAGGSGAGKGHGKGGSNGSSSSDSDDCDDGADAEGSAGGSAGGRGGGSGGHGPTGGDAFDGFEHFPPAGGLDPIVLLPVAFAAVAACLPTFFSCEHTAAVVLERASTDDSKPAPWPVSKDLLSNPGSRKAARNASSKEHSKQRKYPSAADQLKEAEQAAAAAAARGESRTPAALNKPGQPHAVLDSDEHCSHLPWYQLHDPSKDQQVLVFECSAAKAASNSKENSNTLSAAAAQEAGYNHMQLNTAAMYEPAQRYISAAHQPPAAFTSQQVSWEELEDLPLIARQEILSLRAVVARNKQQQHGLLKQLENLQQQIKAKDADLAVSVASNVQLQAELSAALAELASLTSQQHGDLADVVPPASRSSMKLDGAASMDQVKKSYQAQIATLSKAVTDARSEAALQVSALQTQLELSQMAAAEAVADLEQRLSKLAASKAKMQRNLEQTAASLQAQLSASQDEVASLQDTVANTASQLLTAEEQLRLAKEEASQMLQGSEALLKEERAARLSVQSMLDDAVAAACDAREQLQEQLAATTAEMSELSIHLAACGEELVAAKQQAAEAKMQLQASEQQLTDLQGQHQNTTALYKAHVSELTEELRGVRAGYAPLLAGLERELTEERSKATKQVAQMKQQLAEAEASVQQQMQQLQAQLNLAHISVQEASSRSEHLQLNLDLMQQQHEIMQAEMAQLKASFTSHTAELESSLHSNKAELEAARSAAVQAAANGTAAVWDYAVLSQQLDSPKQHAHELQQSLECSLAEARQQLANLKDEMAQLQQRHMTDAASAALQLDLLCTENKQHIQALQQTLDNERCAAAAKLAAAAQELEGMRLGYSTFVAKLEDELAQERESAGRQVAEVKQQLHQAQARLAASAAALAAAKAEATIAQEAMRHELEHQSMLVQTLQQQIGKLETEAARLTAEKVSLDDICHETQRQTQGTIATLQEQVEQLRQQECDAQQRCSELESQLSEQQAAAAARVANLQGQVLALHSSCEQLKAELVAIGGEDGELANLRQQLENQRLQMTKEVKALQEVLSKQEADAVAQINELLQQVTEHSSHEQQLEEQLQARQASASADMEQARAGFTRYTHALEAELEATRQTHTTKLADLNALLAAAREEKEQLNYALALLGGAITCSRSASAANVSSLQSRAVPAAAGECVTTSLAGVQQWLAEITSLSEADKSLSSQVDILQQQLGAERCQHDQQVQHLRSQLTALQASLAAAEEQQLLSETCVQEATAAVQVAEGQAAALAKQLLEAEANTADSTEHICTLQLQLAAAEQQLAGLRQELASKEVDLQNATAAKAAAEAHVEHLTSQTGAADAQAGATVAALEAQLYQAQQQLQEMQSLTEGNTAKLVASAVSMQALHTQLAAAVEHCAGADDNATTLQSQAQAIEQQIVLLQQCQQQHQLAIKDAMVAELQQEIGQLSTEQRQLRSDVTARCEESERLRHTLEQQQAVTESIQTAASNAAVAAAQQVAQLSAKLCDSKQDSERHAAEVAKLAASLEEASSKAAALQAELAALHSRHIAETGALEAAVESASEQRDELESQLQTALAELQDIQARLAAAEQVHAEIVANLRAELAAAADVAADKVAALEAQVAAATAAALAATTTATEAEAAAVAARTELQAAKLHADGLAESHAAAMAALQLEHTATIAAAADAAMAKSDAAHTAALEQSEVAHNQTVTELQQQHAVAIEQLQEEHCNAIFMLESKHAVQLTELRQQVAAAQEAAGVSTEELLKQHAAEVSWLQSQHEQALVTAKYAADAAIIHASAAHAAAIDALKIQHEMQMNDLQQQLAHSQQQKEQKVQDMQQQHAAALAQLKQQLDDALAAAAATAAAALAQEKATHDAELAALHAEQAARIAELQEHQQESAANAEQRLQDLHRQHAVAVAELQQKQNKALMFLEAALSSTETAHDGVLSALEEKHAADLLQHQQHYGSRTAALEQQILHLQQRHVAAIEAVQKQHGQAVSALEDATSRSDKAHGDVLRAMEEQQAAALAELQRQLGVAAEQSQQQLLELQQQHAAATAELQQQRDSAMNEASADHEAAISVLQAQQAKELAQLKQHLDDSQAEQQRVLQDVQQQHSAVMNEMQQRHAKELAAAQQASTAAIAVERAAHAAAIAALEQKQATDRNELQQQFAAATAAHEGHIHDLQQQHTTAIAELQQKHAEALAAGTNSAESALADSTAVSEAALAALKAQHALQLSHVQEQLAAAATDSQFKQQELQQQHTAAMTELQVQHAQALEQAGKTAAETMAATSTNHAAALAAMEAEHSAKISQLQQQHADAALDAGQQLHELQQQLDTAMKTSSDAKVEAAASSAVVANLESELQAVRADLEQQLKQLQTQHAVAEQESAAKIVNLQQQMEQQHAAVSVAEAEKQQLRKQLDSMQAELAAATLDFASKEQEMQHQLDTAQQGLQDNILQMETAFQDLAAADARHSQLMTEKAALEAEKTALLDRCLEAEKQLTDMRNRQADQSAQLVALRMQLSGQPVDSLSRGHFSPDGATSRKSRGLVELVPEPSPAPMVGLIAAAAPAALLARSMQAASGAAATAAIGVASACGVVAGSSSAAKQELARQSSDLQQLSSKIAELVAHSNERQQKLDDLSAQLVVTRSEVDKWQLAAHSAQQQQQAAQAAQSSLEQQLQQRSAEVDATAADLLTTKQQLHQAEARQQETAQQLADALALYTHMAAQHHQQQEKAAELAARLAATEQQVTQLNSQLQEGKDECQQLQQQLDRGAAERQALQQQVGAATGQHQTLQGQLADRTAAVEALEQQLAASQNATALLQQEIAATVVQQQQLQSQMTKKESQLQSLQGELSLAKEAATQHAEAEGIARQQLAEATASREAVHQQLAKLHQVVEQAEHQSASEAANLQQQLVDATVAHNTELAAVKQQLVEAQAACASAAAKVADMAEAAETAAACQAQLQVKHDNLVAQYETLVSERDGLASKCAVLQQTTTELEVELGVSQQQLQELESTATASKHKVEQVSQQLSTAQDELQQLQHSLEEASTLSASLQQQLCAANERKAELQQELEHAHLAHKRLEQDNAQIVGQLVSLEQELDAAKQLSVQQHADKEAAAEQVAALRTAQESLESQFSSLQSEKDSLAAQLQELNEALLAAKTAAASDAAEASKAAEQLHQQVTETLGQKQALQNRLDANIALLAAAQAELAMLHKQFQQAVIDKQALEQQVPSLSTSLKNTEAQLSHLTDDMANQQRVTEELSQRLTQTEQARQQEREAATVMQHELEQQLQQQVAAAVAATAELAAAREMLSTAQAASAAADEELAALKTAAAAEKQLALESENVELNSQLAAAVSDSEAQSSKLATLQAYSSQLVAEQSSLEQQVESLQQQIQELADAADSSTGAQQQLKLLQQELSASTAQLAEAVAAKQQAEVRVAEAESQLTIQQGQLHDLQERLTAADDAQHALTLQLLEKDQEAKLHAQNSSHAGSWRLSAVTESAGGVAPGANTGALEAALAEARHQLSCWEQDVLSLQFVAKHEDFEDICDLDMSYNNTHLEIIHRVVMDLRKQLAAAPAPLPSSVSDTAADLQRHASTEIGRPTSPLGRLQSHSPDSAASMSPGSSPRTSATRKLATLEAQAGQATTRSLAVGSALDSSLQAMQAAKLSLMSMHDKDMKLELISQSVQEVLSGKPLSASNSRGGASGTGAVTGQPSNGGVESEASITDILLAAKTKSDADALVARVFSSESGASASSAADSSRFSGHGSIRTTLTGVPEELISQGGGLPEPAAHLAMELEQYKQQVEQLLEAKQALQDELSQAAARADEVSALRAEQEASEAEKQQLILQIELLNENASSVEQLDQQLQELRAANAELMASKQQLVDSMAGMQQQWQQLQEEHDKLQQQSSRVHWLEEEVLDLQLQIAGLMQQNKDLAAELAAAKALKSSSAADAGLQVQASGEGAGAVSAIRAATQTLMQLEVGAEQMMLPTSDDQGHFGSQLPLSTGIEDADAADERMSTLKPLKSPLLLGSVMLPDEQPMAQMLSSEDNEHTHSKPFSAELEAEYMHYTNPALMAQSMAEGSNRRPALPRTEDDEGFSQDGSYASAAIQGSSALPAAYPADDGTAGKTGMIASSAVTTGSSSTASKRSSALHSREYNVVIVPSAADASAISSNASTTSKGSAQMGSGLAVQQLAKRALNKLKMEEGGGRGSWPGAATDKKINSMDLTAVMHDINKLASISTELAEQQTAVQTQLAASQALAESMKQQAAAHDVSMDEVVGHFFNVYNIACFVATDRERVLDQLIEAREAQQDLSGQLASRANQIQQLASDRDLALQKLCHSEEKLVQMEKQLTGLQQQIQNQAANLAAKVAAIDVATAAGVAGPLSGLTPQQVAELNSLLAEANQIVQHQRGSVQDALLKWRRSSGSGSGMGTTAADDSTSQLAWLQHEQRQLMQELSSLSVSSAASGSVNHAANIHDSAVGFAAAAADHSQPIPISEGGAAFTLEGSGLLLGGMEPLPPEVTAYINSLAQRMAAMQSLTEHISAEVVRKHEEALALQNSFMQVEVAKQLLEKQLIEKSSESATLQQALQQLSSQLSNKQVSTSQLSGNQSACGVATPVAISSAPQLEHGQGTGTDALSLHRCSNSGNEHCTAAQLATSTSSSALGALNVPTEELVLNPKPGFVMSLAQHFEAEVSLARKSLPLVATSSNAEATEAAAAEEQASPQQLQQEQPIVVQQHEDQQDQVAVQQQACAPLRPTPSPLHLPSMMAAAVTAFAKSSPNGSPVKVSPRLLALSQPKPVAALSRAVSAGAGSAVATSAAPRTAFGRTASNLASPSASRASSIPQSPYVSVPPSPKSSVPTSPRGSAPSAVSAGRVESSSKPGHLAALAAQRTIPGSVFRSKTAAGSGAASGMHTPTAVSSMSSKAATKTVAAAAGKLSRIPGLAVSTASSNTSPRIRSGASSPTQSESSSTVSMSSAPRSGPIFKSRAAGGASAVTGGSRAAAGSKVDISSTAAAAAAGRTAGSSSTVKPKAASESSWKK